MIIHDFTFFISESIITMRRSALMTFITIATITVSLFIFGLFLLLNLNLNNISNTLVSKLEIRLFLKPGLNQQDISTFETAIGKMDGVKSISFIDRHAAWKKFKPKFLNLNLDSALLNKNPLPHSLNIQVSHQQSVSPLAKQLKQFTNYVEDVTYGGDIAERVEGFYRFAKLGGFLAVSLLGLSTLLIIINTIRLTIISRQNEITIMRLVGASSSFIKWPFLIEGFIMGVIGSIVAIVVLCVGYKLFGSKAQEAVPFLPLVFDKLSLIKIYGFVGFVGICMAVSGAYFSVSKTLRQQY